DETPPVISNINVVVTSNSATVTWQTDEPATSQIVYGMDSNYSDSTNLDQNMVTAHSQIISNLSANTTYYFKVKSADGSGNLVISDESSFTTSEAQAYVVRVNAGGDQYSRNGKTWEADKPFENGSWGYVGGRTYRTSHSISNTSDPVLYQSERYRMEAYRFTVPASGTYEVNLHFAEIFYGSSDIRVFSVEVEGQRVLIDFDIYDEAGKYSALVKTFTVQVNDGVLDINFIKDKDSPKISAIEVASQAPGFSMGKTIAPESEQLMEPIIPERFVLAAPYPNPFNMETKIRLEIPESGMLFAAIYNIRGQKLITLSDEQVMAGEKLMMWNGRDEYGIEASSGIYLLKVVYLGENNQRISQTKRLVLMK
ncbi:hypothetical protein B6D60_00330, partial [candidate division KSB1 bacterium 4484_87]